jgi:bacillaene synthase trans-acting acyltransferase
VAAPEIVFMFSGQGSQYFQMGKALYDGNDTFREWMLRLDELARQALGQSVLAAVYSSSRGKGDPFSRALLTHPAIFIIEYALAQALMGAGVVPDLVLGASMGSFAAAAVAGFLDVEDAMQAVVRQAIALEECGEPGGMTAVLADPAVFGEDFFAGRCELAGINFSTHFVISAKRPELEEIETALRKRSVGFQRLPVMFPFHSQWIDRAKTPFQSFMNTVMRRQGHVPLVCCDQTAILAELSDAYFWDVVRWPIRFRETTARLEQGGPRRYVDLGPGGTLATFLKYGLPAGSRSTAHAIVTPFGTDQKNFVAVSQSLGH